ncbi:MAG: ion channel [Bacteroidia bacterium]|nr:ion channel [Bacteroidia bacterium]
MERKRKQKLPTDAPPRTGTGSIPEHRTETDAGPQPAYKDLGFGTGIGTRAGRLLHPDGSFNVRRVDGFWRSLHPYQFMITAPFWKFVLIISAAYVAINSGFTALYLLAGPGQLSGEVAGAPFHDRFFHAFFFSAQTLTTVGYGSVSPVGMAANVIAAFEAMTGVLVFAIAAGLFYGRFAKPSAYIRFSREALIAPYRNGLNSFQFRIVNGRRSDLIELEVLVTLMWHEMDQGKLSQRFIGLSLERKSVNLFPLNWTIVHPIGPDSPLYGHTPEALQAMHAEFLIMIKAYDETFAQTVHVRRSYRADEVVWGRKFVPMYYTDEAGAIVLEVDKTGMHQEAALYPMPVPAAEALS